jgi:hypothetical protein
LRLKTPKGAAGMSAEATMSVSVIMERRTSNSPWQDYYWRPIGVLPQVAHEHGKLLSEGDDWAHFQVGTLQLELHRGETEGYLVNLSQSPPVVFVILRRGESAEELDVEPFHVTVCPYEAMGYGESGDETVESVVMPPEVMAWLGEFVARYHVDQPFLKRKNRRHQDESGIAPPVRNPRRVS